MAVAVENRAIKAGLFLMLIVIGVITEEQKRCGDGHCTCKCHTADCRYSRLTYIPRLPVEITELNLSFTHDTLDHTRIEDDKDFFVNATGIETLRMVSCGLRRVPKLPESVTVVDLSFNPITKIGEDDFHLSPNIESLTMANCGLTSIAPSAFDDLVRLKRLDLSYNRFVIFPISSLSHSILERLDFFDFSNNNYLVCDCNAAALSFLMRSKPYLFTLDQSRSVADLSKLYKCWNSIDEPMTQLSIIELGSSDGSSECEYTVPFRTRE